MTEPEVATAETVPSPADLLRPCLEKIKQETQSRKYVKLQEDLDTLLNKLEVFVGSSRASPPPVAAAPDPKTSTEPSDPAYIGVDLATTADGKLRFNILLEGKQRVDSGHMPSSPVGQSNRPQRRAGALADGAAREMMLVLHDAIDTRKPVVMEAGLDCLQKLVSFKLIQGPVHSINHKRETALRPGSNKVAPEDVAAPLQFAAQPPQAQAVELMCRCDDTGDEAVELRLLKALLTATTSPTLTVHGQALLLTVRACYNVFLMSRSEVAQATSKATLTQMLNVVFQRLEAGRLSVIVPPLAVSDVLGLQSSDASSMSAFVQQFLLDVASAVDPFGSFAEGVQAGLDDAFSHHGALHSSGPAAEELYDPSDPVDSQKISWRSEEKPTKDIRDDLSCTDDGASEAFGATNGADILTTSLQKDAFLVFRALCKLSIRSADAMAGSDVTTLRGKILALELLKILLENSGPVFANGDRFIGAIKQYLCLSLLKNCASGSLPVQRLCASIFLTLVTHFRRNLKAEIGVFYPMVLLKPLEPPTGSVPGGTAAAPAIGANDTAQKAIALRCLQLLCADGQLLVDLFVNYDCDLSGANLFERTVNVLVRIANILGAPAEPPESQALRYEAFKCLVSALEALRQWYDVSLASQTGNINAVEEMGKNGLATSVQNSSAGHGDEPSNNANSTIAASSSSTQSELLGVVDESLRSKWMKKLAAGIAEGGVPPGITSGRSEAELLRSWKAFKKAFEEGVALFNKKPKKGIALLQSKGMLGETPEEVAVFLASTRGLDKTHIGDYLGEREDFNLHVMHAYVDALDFVELEFDAAIRKFLAGFRLPGEAQKIDRLMEKFAERFVRCNPEAFKSADVAYVLAYSVIMLNTDAHNPMVKNKMSKADFLRNNRGINDGGDLDVDFMESLYDRIVNNEIKMKDEPGEGLEGEAEMSAANAGWLDTVMGLFPGSKRAANTEPTEAAIRRTHEFLRQQAKGATFFEAKDGEAVRPMVDVAWAPTMGALSILFEQEEDELFVAQCLDGFVAAIGLTSRLNMRMLQATFVASLARCTMLHAPGRMKMKHAQAFRAILFIADTEGNSLGDNWNDILRCVSRFELLLQLSAGVPTDDALFSAARPQVGNYHNGTTTISSVESFTSIGDMSLQASMKTSAPTGRRDPPGLPPPDVLAAVDSQELNRFFVDSVRLDSDAIVGFVATLCNVARDELRPGGPPRVFSLGKIVEIAHWNMGRIRLVWGRIWAVLADFFTIVGCHESLAVSMYAVDSLRQLAMKFLERDELANYTFQNDFLRPFVALMRQSRSAEIRELVIRCVSQMVLARVASIKSGWKSVFMVFTTAACDDSPHIVRLAFDTVEKIVREHFVHITETETATFTDLVNCLVAFTNNPHSLDVSLNAIAFLRYCAMELAEGDIGELPEGALPEGFDAALDPNTIRIRPKAGVAEAAAAAAAVSAAAAAAKATVANNAAFGAPTASVNGNGTVESKRKRTSAIRFTDRDEHMYFWFPLLAGLSELTFDPRQEIRYGALGVLFDILKFHGSSFTSQFWIRVFDSVLLPMFDHVRAEITDTTTFTDDVRRAEVDAWLYETCTATLQHMVDVVVRYYQSVPELLTKTLELLDALIQRPHAALAAVGVAALTRLALACGETATEETWNNTIVAFQNAEQNTIPDAGALIQQRMAVRAEGGTWSLSTGAGARRLAEVRCRAGTQLLLAQACGEVYAAHSRYLPTLSSMALLDTLKNITVHAISVNGDVGLRHSLSMAQAADSVETDRALSDPPLLKLEVEAAQAYLSLLLSISACGPPELQEMTGIKDRLMDACLQNLERFEQQSQAASAASEGDYPGSVASLAAENEALAPLAVATLKALLSYDAEGFKARVKELYPVLINLISSSLAAPEIQAALSELLLRVGATD